MRWASLALLVFLASSHVSIAFTVSGNVFTKLRKDRDDFVRQMLAPVPAPTRQTGSSAEAEATMPATKSPLFPCVPCLVSRFYSHLDSYSVSTKLMGVASPNAGESPERPLSFARSIVDNLMRNLWRAASFPVRYFIHMVQKRKKPIANDSNSASNDEVVPTVSEVTIVEPSEELAVAEPSAVQTATVAASSGVAVAPSIEVAPAPTPAVPTSKPRAYPLPKGERWAVAAPNVDLSGDWGMYITEEFKQEYDLYLKNLGQPLIVRSVALGIIGLTTEFTSQKDDGRVLHIKGTNARGVWERSLVASGASSSEQEFEPHLSYVMTADDEEVEAESWWEDSGKVHRSWMRGVTKYGGGDFEAKRYLEEDGKILVCESIFHPKEAGRVPAKVTWRFLRKGTTLE